jgi:hypothetical protein
MVPLVIVTPTPDTISIPPVSSSLELATSTEPPAVPVRRAVTTMSQGILPRASVSDQLSPHVEQPAHTSGLLSRAATPAHDRSAQVPFFEQPVQLGQFPSVRVLQAYRWQSPLASQPQNAQSERLTACASLGWQFRLPQVLIGASHQQHR